jgi:hypothetical protein
MAGTPQPSKVINMPATRCHQREKGLGKGDQGTLSKTKHSFLTVTVIYGFKSIASKNIVNALRGFS